MALNKKERKKEASIQILRFFFLHALIYFVYLIVFLFGDT